MLRPSFAKSKHCKENRTLDQPDHCKVTYSLFSQNTVCLDRCRYALTHFCTKLQGWCHYPMLSVRNPISHDGNLKL